MYLFTSKFHKNRSIERKIKEEFPVNIKYDQNYHFQLHLFINNANTFLLNWYNYFKKIN